MLDSVYGIKHVSHKQYLQHYPHNDHKEDEMLQDKFQFSIHEIQSDYPADKSYTDENEKQSCTS